ncbi:MAG: hypothetical protein KZQ85_00690 [Candidatus Thiodiazotropha sp. (ex Myrtea sp. 'scaly one' KF741663)]|nr:hypothetical protein [Candidatus Thiodiazotropha sp. (ex Myrtea sp. 'scaly one' KF741663)]
MQIGKTHTLPAFPVPLEPSRGRAPTEVNSLAALPQVTQESRPTRAVDDIKQAERMLERQRARDTYGTFAEESNQQKAVAAYQSLQQNDERDYVSEVLGIDVYA